MKELGLHHINTRINDKVNFIDPDEDNEAYQTNINSLFSHTWRNHSPEGRDRAIKMFENDGLDGDDLIKYVDNLMETAEFIGSKGDDLIAVDVPCFLITAGIK